MIFICRFFLGCSTLLLAHVSLAESLYLAVASNFAPAMRDIAHEFEQKTQHNLKLSFSSSGKIYAQILHGAPYDAFFSADQEKPTRLEKQGLALKGSRITYAEGTLVLWSTSEKFIVDNESSLTNGKYNKVALANPKLAPYGAAAMEVLTALKLKSPTKNKQIMGENISQTYQFVRSGSADIGFLALSQVKQHNKDSEGFYWTIPKHLYRPILQDAVIIKRSKNTALASEFFEFLKSDVAVQIVQEYGYTIEPK